MQKVKYFDSIIQLCWIKATLAMTCWHWPWDWETIFYRICAFVNSNLKTMLNSDPKMSDSLNNMEFARTSQLRFGHFGMNQEFGLPRERCLTYCCRYDDASSDIASQKFDNHDWDKTLNFRWDMKKHMRVHLGTTKTCFHCGNIFQTTVERRTHEKKHSCETVLNPSTPLSKVKSTHLRSIMSTHPDPSAGFDKYILI